ncbi:Methyltransferase-like protein 24 [Varanus komodoensis]|nr:Methyltransferase-like protein 24 [Varanus komodoensis]
MGTGRCSHITPVLHQLHWLPIEVRAQFKVLVITYKALNGLGPGYLKECLRPYMPSRPLRLAAKALLQEPSVKDIRRGLNAFQLSDSQSQRNALIDILKADMESAEWKILENLILEDVVEQIGQLVFEIHVHWPGFEDSAPSLSTVQKWSSQFKRGRESIEDDPCSGGSVTATTKENVKKIEKLVLEDARIKIKMLAEMTNLSVGIIFTIFHDHLNLSKVCARWVLQMLMAPQKQVQVKCCRELLELSGEDPLSIFDRIVTGDETWVHQYDPESKQESMQWHKKGADPLKKFKVTPSAGKIMATVFWDSKGILLIEYMKKGETKNAASYATTLHNLREAIKEKRWGKLTAGVLLLHNNTPVHTAHISKAAA